MMTLDVLELTVANARLLDSAEALTTPPASFQVPAVCVQAKAGVV